MSFASRLKERREELNLSQNALAKELGITKAAISNYENEISSPKADILYSLFKALKCDANYLFQDEMNELEKNEVFTQKEKILIKKYRALENNGIKLIIENLLDIEYKRIQEQDNAIYDDDGNRITSFQEYLNFKYQSAKVLYIDKVSAGLGFFPVEEEYQQIGSPFTNANYAFSVDGNSMFPKYQNGDMIYVKKQNTLYDGDIGVIVYNGKGYLKKYYKDNNDIYLVSLNEDYNDISITLDENVEFYIVGKVVGYVPLKEFMK